MWFYQLLSWYLAPLGCRLNVSRLDTSIPKKELVSRPPGGSLDVSRLDTSISKKELVT